MGTCIVGSMVPTDRERVAETRLDRTPRRSVEGLRRGAAVRSHTPEAAS